MPELPEVESLVRELRPRLEQRRIEGVRILRDRLVADPGARTFAARLRGRRISALRRRGKTLWAELDDGGHWLTHLRMTGWFLHRREPGPPADPHVLAVVTLDRGELHYRDLRRFGRMWWTRDPGAHFRDLGPEPLGAAFTLEGLRAALARRRIPVKQLLLDPALVAGIGNIYASEACHVARIDPRTPANRIGAVRAARLRTAIRSVLRRAVRLGAVPRKVRLPREFRVYGRASEPCHECGASIRRVVLGQRSTFFCPRCQR